jgi:hypothetical protein
MNLVFTLGMYDDHHLTPQYAECYPPLLTVVFAIIFEGEGWASEDPFSVSEIQAAPVAGGLSFGFVPSEAHSCYYTYKRVYVNA